MAYDRLEDAIAKANAAAERLLKCAESISNPVYHVTMDGKELQIQAVQHFAGQISIVVKSPFDSVHGNTVELKTIGGRKDLIANSRDEWPPSLPETI